MNKIILEKLIYRSYLKTALTSILFIEVALIIIYFSASNNMVNESVDFILKDIKKNVYEQVSQSTSNVEHRFEDIEKLATILQNEHQNFFKYQNNINLENPPKFDFAENGMYYKLENNGGSSIVVSKKTPITEKVKKKLINSELFDNTFKTIVNDEPLVVAVYFNSFDDVNRYYPFIEDTYNAFPSDIKMENYNFYYEADLKHNPEKKVVWTDVYLDPAGQGWMSSAIVPIYKDGFLEGVTGLDVTIDSMIKSFLNFKLPYEGSSFLIDKEGNIIAMTNEVEKILNLKNNPIYKYSNDEKIDKTIYKKDYINIFEYKNDEMVSILKDVLNKEFTSNSFSLNDNRYLLFSQKINRMNWYVVSIINQEKVTSDVRKLETHYQFIGYLIIAFIVLFYLIFFIYLYKKAREFVDTLNKPLLKIIEMTKNLGMKKDIQKLEDCGIEEIDILNDNFNTLARELDERTKKLIESETKREHHEKMANTDALTKVYNRRFLEDFSNKYMKIVKRENTTLSLLLIDIDRFKNINDTYGHDIGDIIIKNLVDRIKKVIRENDIIVRLGGDEFVVLLPNTNMQNARKVAKKLVVLINTINQLEKEELTFTTSIGISEYKKDDNNIDDLIKRADKALYEAKRLGRNRIV